MTVAQLAPTSPLVGEMATSAMLNELAWNNEAVLQEFADAGLTPLTPQANSGEYFFLCNPDNDTTTAEAWAGRSVRIGSQAGESAVRDMGANPVSLEYVEAFEGLQRGTIDCTMTQLGSAASFGVHSSKTTASRPRSRRRSSRILLLWGKRGWSGRTSWASPTAVTSSRSAPGTRTTTRTSSRTRRPSTRTCSWTTGRSESQVPAPASW